MISRKRRERREPRMNVALDVMLSEQNGGSTREWAWTENISARGARILTVHSKNLNERLLIRCVEANLSARGKVVYRQCLHENLFAIGVRLVAPKGQWGELPDAQPRGLKLIAGAPDRKPLYNLDVRRRRRDTTEPPIAIA